MKTFLWIACASALLAAREKFLPAASCGPGETCARPLSAEGGRPEKRPVDQPVRLAVKP